MTTIIPETIVERLEERLRAGRNPAEAAGEVRWLIVREQEANLISQESRQEVFAVINEWLTSKDPEHDALYQLAAEQYERFIADRVDIMDYSTLATVQLDEALGAWRAQT